MLSGDNLDLVSRLQDAADVEQVSDEHYHNIQRKLAFIMGCDDEERRWWWENQNSNRFVFSYNEKHSFYSDLMRLTEGIDRNVYIFITGDKVPPWRCFRGGFSKISNEIEESSLTEFIILDCDFHWAMADTHHNQLMLYGHISI